MPTLSWIPNMEIHNSDSTKMHVPDECGKNRANYTINGEQQPHSGKLLNPNS